MNYEIQAFHSSGSGKNTLNPLPFTPIKPMLPTLASFENEMARKKTELMIKKASVLADLNRTLTSPGGGKFRIELLQACSTASFCTEIEELRTEKKLTESERHIHQLMRFKLISVENKGEHKIFYRTANGEKAVNSVKALTSRIGSEQAEKIFKASFGENSLRLFLKAYDKKCEEKLDERRLFFTPSELTRLSLFLPRTIEGIAAFEKLNDAGLLVYEDDGNIHLPPVIAREFHCYLSDLYDIIKVKIFKRKG